MACHCAMKRGCERRAIALVTTIVTGIVTSAINASSGEITNMKTTTPMTVSSEVSSWLSVCCRLWAMLSMSFVTRLSNSPRGWPST